MWERDDDPGQVHELVITDGTWGGRVDEECDLVVVHTVDDDGSPHHGRHHQSRPQYVDTLPVQVRMAQHRVAIRAARKHTVDLVALAAAGGTR